MHPQPSAMLIGAGAGSASFVGALAVNITTSPQAISFPPNTAVGDLAIISTTLNSTFQTTITGGDGGWTTEAFAWPVGYKSTLHRKVLTAGDLAGVSVSSSGALYTLIVAVYRGPSGAANKSTVVSPNSSSSLTLVGFTKSSNCKGVVTIAHDRDTTSNPSRPSGFTMRAGPGNFGNFTGNIADLLAPANYINGAGVTWTDFNPSNSQGGWLLELT